jgi:hypothetical protein
MQAGYPGNVFALPAPVSFRSLAEDFRNSLVHKWNIAVQRQLPWQMALEVAYVGNHQAHGLIQPNQNFCPNTPSTTGVNCVALEPYPDLGSLFGTASFGVGNYAGMTVKLEKRFSGGLSFLTAYTYGHALSDTGTTLSGSVGFGTIDPANYNTSYSSAAWDIRHNLTTSFSYEVPFGKGKKFGNNMNRAANTIAGNWQLNGVLTLHTGNPFTLDASGCQGQWSICRPDLVSGQNPQAAPSGGRTPSEWFNTAAVTAPAALTGGNLGLQSNDAPPTRTLDFSVFKDFVLTERFNVQFRAESYNLTNTPQFSYPGNNYGQSNFGQITSTLAGTERHIQFALRVQF